MSEVFPNPDMQPPNSVHINMGRATEGGLTVRRGDLSINMGGRETVTTDGHEISSETLIQDGAVVTAAAGVEVSPLVIRMGRSETPDTEEPQPVTAESAAGFFERILSGDTYYSSGDAHRLVPKENGKFDVVNDSGVVVAGNIPRGRIELRFSEPIESGRISI